MRRAVLGGLVLVLLVSGVRAQDQPPRQEGLLPKGNYQISVRAAPTEVQEGDPVTLTLRITATDPRSEEPRRPDLRKLANPQLAPRKLDDLFSLEIPDGEPKRPERNVWEFTYLLRPKQLGTQTLPTLKFVFINLRGGRGQSLTRPPRIRLTVKPRGQAPLPPTGNVAAPPGVFEIATGDAVLRREAPSWWFEPWALALLALAPPLLCGAWYVVWRRLHPDALQLRQRRHARAVRQAIRELKRAADPGGAATAAVVTRYLRQRFDLTVAEPTPAEVAACLQQAGASAALVRRATGLLGACDGARFAPTGARPALAPDAIQFIQSLEADLCAARPS